MKMLSFSISCTRFETNYIVPVQIGAVKIYVAAVEALTPEEERGAWTQDETKFTTKISYRNSISAAIIIIISQKFQNIAYYNNLHWGAY